MLYYYDSFKYNSLNNNNIFYIVLSVLMPSLKRVLHFNCSQCPKCYMSAHCIQYRIIIYNIFCGRVEVWPIIRLILLVHTQSYLYFEFEVYGYILLIFFFHSVVKKTIPYIKCTRSHRY